MEDEAESAICNICEERTKHFVKYKRLKRAKYLCHNCIDIAAMLKRKAIELHAQLNLLPPLPTVIMRKHVSRE